MEKYFCSYERSLALKELGFDEPCLAFYDGKNTESFYFNNLRDASGDYIPFQKHDRLKWFGAPLKSQAFKWFIDKHGLHIHMCPDFYKDGINYCWQILWYLPKDKWTDSNVHGGTMFYGDNHEYPTKEEAENACIDKMIEIVKNK
jgi:hypothetical protein